MAALTREETQNLIAEVLAVYPEKAKKDRAKHLMVNDQSLESSKKCITSNRKSLPGVMTIRGCAYAGSRGVCWGPIKDMVHISHGPVGCGMYSTMGRRHYANGTMGADIYTAINVTSDFQERDIVFGGDKKLKAIIDELEKLFPLARGYTIQSECPIGLIGDDIESVAKVKSAEIGKTIVPVRCEGFRGVSQSLGHHIANDAIRDWVLPTLDNDDGFEGTPYDVNILADYNIGGDIWPSRMLMEEIGLRVIAQVPGDGTLIEMQRSTKAKLNLLHCYRSMNYVSRHMEEKYGIPWMEYNLFGPTKIEASLRAIAERFDDQIKDGVERVLAKYKPQWQAVVDKYRPRLEGKTVMLYVGGLRPRHIVGAYEDLGMKVVGTGYEFAHNDDYDRTIKEMGDATLIYDDVTAYELDEFVKKVKPDLIGSGIKEKYQFQKMGFPFRQMHSWDYSGPYHGYDGFAIFARDMDMTLNNPCWKEIKAPWQRPAVLAVEAA
jgi:nitrogenase molybdenum-iron protein alpha chain